MVSLILISFLTFALFSRGGTYYLAKRHSTSCTIIDPVGIALVASGKAGGFLARDWSDGIPIRIAT